MLLNQLQSTGKHYRVGVEVGGGGLELGSGGLELRGLESRELGSGDWSQGGLGSGLGGWSRGNWGQGIGVGVRGLELGGGVRGVGVEGVKSGGWGRGL